MLTPPRPAREGASPRRSHSHRATAPGWRSVVSDALLDALAVLSPISCAGCSVPDRALCSDCRAALTATVLPRTVSGLRVYTALDYTGVVRSSILALKENGRTDVARPLGQPLRHALAAAFADALAAATAAKRSVAGRPSTTAGLPPAAALHDSARLELVSIPPSRAAWRRRGYDPVALLCRRAGYRDAGYRRARVLVPTRRTRSQKTLGEVERADNLSGSLRARTDLTGRRFVVVDDVVTTGATLLEAQRALTAAGGEVVCGVALAFTPRIFRHTSLAGKVHSDIAR